MADIDSIECIHIPPDKTSAPVLVHHWFDPQKPDSIISITVDLHLYSIG